MLIQNIFLLNFIIITGIVLPKTNITIYNQGRGLIEEIRSIHLTKDGKQKIIIKNLPNNVDPKSINLYSEKINFLSKEFIKKPITNKELLNANINNNIELIKYNENGEISFSTKGKLISNINQPVFLIEDKIVINPPYNYRFDSIPNEISDRPYLNCNIDANQKQAKYKKRKIR